jgi:1,2-phenylacetyl-CoA epoxidase catalytic subunit
MKYVDRNTQQQMYGTTIVVLWQTTNNFFNAALSKAECSATMHRTQQQMYGTKIVVMWQTTENFFNAALSMAECSATMHCSCGTIHCLQQHY